jgi:hypothetical protein
MLRKLNPILLVLVTIAATPSALGQFVAAGTSGVREIRFTLNPGGSGVFSLPSTQSPVRIENKV